MVTRMPMSKSAWASHTPPMRSDGKQRPTPSGVGPDHGERNRWQNSKMI
jgi:hypothetical protein